MVYLVDLLISERLLWQNEKERRKKKKKEEKRRKKKHSLINSIIYTLIKAKNVGGTIKLSTMFDLRLRLEASN